MTENDKEIFGDIMDGIAENFNAQLSPIGIALRFETLKEFSLDEIKRASVAMVRGRKYTTMPTVADFLDYLGGGKVEDIAEVEASKVWKAVGQHGSYATICFDDPVTQAVIENGFGGWIKMCGELMVDQQGKFYREFCRIYGAYSRQKIQQGGWLTGRGGGFQVMVGDKEKCQLVLDMKKDERGLESAGSVVKMLGM